MLNINNTQKYFIEILKAYLNNEPTTISNDIDYSELLSISRLQNLSAIIYDALKDNIPDNYNKAFKNDYDLTIFNNINRNYLVKSINDIFNKNSIKYFIVKGVKVAELYPNPLLRTMGDTDMIMKNEDRKLADQILVSQLDFTRVSDSEDWAYYKNNYEFELHDSLLYKDYGEKDYLNSFWDYVYKKDNGTYELDYNFHFIFLIAHLKKHILGKGAGFRQFIDIALVSRKVDLDLDYIIKTLTDLNLFEFTRNVMTLNNIWFGFDNPFGNTQLSEDFLNDVTNKIFTYGVFGHNNLDYQTNKMVNSGGSKLKFIINSIFPNKEYLLCTHYMKWFKDKPLLLPIAYIYRCFYLLITKFAYITRLLFASKDTINKRNDELSNWGLK